jgi:hypothetical protein
VALLAPIRTAAAKSVLELATLVDRVQDHLTATLNPALKTTQKLALSCAASVGGATTLGTSGSLNVTTAAQTIVWASKSFDTDNAFDLVNGFTVPAAKSGTYLITAMVIVNSDETAGGITFQVNVGGVSVLRQRNDVGTSAAERGGFSVSGLVRLVGGNVVTAQITATVNGHYSLGGIADATNMTLFRVPGL